MPRKPNQPPQPLAPEVSPEPNKQSLAEQELILRHDARIDDLIETFGLPEELRSYEWSTYLAHIQANVGLMQRAGLYAGRLLWVVLEKEGPSRFKEAAALVGIDPDYAKRLIRVAQVTSQSPALKSLSEQLPVGKFLTLMQNLPDDELERIAVGSDDAVLSRDEIDTLSREELRAALRKERAEREQEQAANDEIVARKDKKINDLTKRQRALDRGPVRERVEEMITVYDELIVEHMALANKVETLLSEVKAVYKEAGQRMDPDVDERLEQGAAAIQSQTARICKLAGI